MGRKRIPEDRLIALQNRLSLFPARSPEKKPVIQNFADSYGVSVSTVYRALRGLRNPQGLTRSDAGAPRRFDRKVLEKYIRIISALKRKSRNKKGHHLSTAEAIRLLEYGIETKYGLVKAPKGALHKSTVNYYLKLWEYDLCSVIKQPVSRRFQASRSNQCWQFDLSQSDLKSLAEWPEWINSRDGSPVLMLYSVVDDRSGLVFQKYDVAYGEDAESALRFLFFAMSRKDIEGFPFQGIPEMIYMDNGPIARSQVFQRVMRYLGVDVRRHLPEGKDGRRKTARSKGKVERPFRTVKELHETLYHFHKPKNIDEANEWLQNYILRYNEKPHRFESHSRIDDWIKNLPPSGIRQMCSWERFCTFAREPEKRKIGPDAQIRVDQAIYEVDHELADRQVVIWRGLFDHELYVEHREKKYGPYHPSNGPIPLNRFRRYKKTAAEKKADSIEQLAEEIRLPVEILSADERPAESLLRKLPEDTLIQSFQDPDPFHENAFPSLIAAKEAISKKLGMPLAKLTDEERRRIDEKLAETLDKTEIIEMVTNCFRKRPLLRVIEGDKAK